MDKHPLSCVSVTFSSLIVSPFFSSLLVGSVQAGVKATRALGDWGGLLPLIRRPETKHRELTNQLESGNFCVGPRKHASGFHDTEPLWYHNYTGLLH